MRRPSRLLVATGNPGKLAELRDLLAGTGVTALSPRDVGWDASVPETGATLEENALAKARAGGRATGLPTLADDTGLFVEALGGGPGVHSARYAGEAQDPAANCARLLDALAGVPDAGRGASFRCAVALVDPTGLERVFIGETRGRIARSPRGSSGFGYDPLFQSEETGRTFAEMTAEEKHGVSHRGRALASLRRFLETLPEEDRS